MLDKLRYKRKPCESASSLEAVGSVCIDRRSLKKKEETFRVNQVVKERKGRRESFKWREREREREREANTCYGRACFICSAT